MNEGIQKTVIQNLQTIAVTPLSVKQNAFETIFHSLVWSTENNVALLCMCVSLSIVLLKLTAVER